MANKEETILVRIKSMLDGSGFDKANSSAKNLKTTMAGIGLAAAGAKFAAFTKDAVSAAMTAEQEWNKFGNAVNNSGGNWEQQSAEIKSWVKDYSNSMGRAVGDTRAALTTFMNMGMSLQDSQNAMKATSNMAAQLGMSQEEAAGQLQKAFMGNGRAIKQLGLDIKNYKDETTGAIDKQKLMNDILARTNGAADKYANSTAGKMQRVQNQIAALKTEFGSFVVDALSPFIPVAENLLKFLNSMPGPVKSTTFAIVALGGGFALLAGPIMTAVGALKTFLGVFGKLGSTTSKMPTGGTGGGKAAGKGIVGTLQGLKGFGRALLGLVPDIIMAAAAVAVIIAVIFALAAEVIVLTKGIQMLIDAMDFGGIDLSDDIDGLKKLKEAMWEIAQIMGAMAISNVANAVTQFTGGVLNLAVSLKTIKDAYKKVAEALKDIAGMEDINQGGLDKLKKISEALKAVGDSMSALNQLSGGMNIGNAINGFVAWLTGGEADPVANIDTVINKIKDIAPKLDGLKNLPDIDGSGVEKIRKIGDAMKSLSDAMTSMQGYSGGFLGGIMDWWNGDLSAQVEKAITQINQVGQKFSMLGTYTIPDMSWVQRAATGMQYLKSAMDVMNGYAGMQINTEVPELIGRAVTAVKMVAQQLQGLQGTESGDINTVLSQIQQAVEQMKATLAAANFTAEGVNIGTSLVTGVQSGLAGLPGVVGDASNQAVSTAEGILPPGMGNVASNATNAFRDNLKLADIASQEMDYAVQAINNKSGALYEAARNAAQQAVQGGRDGAQSHSPGAFARMWGREVGEYSPSLIGRNAPKLYNAMKTAASNAVNQFGTPNLGFTTGADLLNNLGAMNTNYPTIQSDEGQGNTYYIGEGAFNIHVSDMTDQECKSVILQALESL